MMDTKNTLNGVKKTTRMLTSLKNAIPDDIQQRLIWLGDQDSDIAWEIADITNAIIKWVNDDADVDADDMDIYAFVAALVGNGQSTIRYYAYTGRDYPVEERDWYPPLTFKHFATAKKYGDLKHKILRSCMTYMEKHGGRRPSCDWIDAHFKGVTQAEMELNYDELTIENALDGVESTHSRPSYNTVGVWSDILTASAYIRSKLDVAETTAERRDELQSMMDEFDEYIREELE